MNLSTLYKIEYTKLFRKSNVLFLFLFVYMCLPSTMRFEPRFMTASLSFYEQTVFYISVFFGMLLMSIFILNNTGNDFNEGSYRKNLAIGLFKKDYFAGKLLLIILFALFVLVFTFIIYFSFGMFGQKIPFYELISQVRAISLANQFIALFHAGLFGLFFIMVFRNRIIGLVFLPFWFFTEFVFLLLAGSGTLKLPIDYMPVKACYNLYNSHIFDLKAMAVVVVISATFMISAWLGLYLREEKA